MYCQYATHCLLTLGFSSPFNHLKLLCQHTTHLIPLTTPSGHYPPYTPYYTVRTLPTLNPLLHCQDTTHLIPFTTPSGHYPPYSPYHTVRTLQVRYHFCTPLLIISVDLYSNYLNRRSVMHCHLNQTSYLKS